MGARNEGPLWGFWQFTPKPHKGRSFRAFSKQMAYRHIGSDASRGSDEKSTILTGFFGDFDSFLRVWVSSVRGEPWEMLTPPGMQRGFKIRFLKSSFVKGFCFGFTTFALFLHVKNSIFLKASEPLVWSYPPQIVLFGLVYHGPELKGLLQKIWNSNSA